jgi:hypothetical protein
MERELADTLDDLVLGRGVARGRHDLQYRGRSVRAELEDRLAANGFLKTTVGETEIAAGERVPAFYVKDDAADFGYVRWEIFTPRSRRKLFASQRRRPDNQEWAIQLSPSSSERIWADPARKERHDIEVVVAVNP